LPKFLLESERGCVELSGLADLVTEICGLKRRAIFLQLRQLIECLCQKQCGDALSVCTQEPGAGISSDPVLSRSGSRCTGWNKALEG